jgi:hypothetical protein
MQVMITAEQVMANRNDVVKRAGRGKKNHNERK